MKAMKADVNDVTELLVDEKFPVEFQENYKEITTYNIDWFPP